MDNQHNSWYSSDRRRSQSYRNPVHDAQSLLAVYPISSATPATHVTRHLDNMMITAAPPSFIQPHSYSVHSNSQHRNGQPPPPYTEYATELSYMANAPVSDDGGYWRNHAASAVRYLQEQAGPSYPYPPVAQASWPPSSYQTSHLANTVFQHAQAASAYPTPPPVSSSSSLAGALGPPVTAPPVTAPPVRQQVIHPPAQSNKFFDDYLTQKTREMSVTEIPTSRTPTSSIKTKPAPSESPDPMNLKPRNPAYPSLTTPSRKRKPVVELSSPSWKKRIHSADAGHSTSKQHQRTHVATIFETPSSSNTPVPVTPSSSSTSLASPSSTKTTSTRKTYTLDCVAIPHKPFLTPTSSHKKRSTDRMQLDESPDPLAGYGTEDDSPIKGRSLLDPLTASRQRDDRAPLQKVTTLIEDILYREESLPAEGDIADLPLEYFSSRTANFTEPLLNSQIIRKLTKHIGSVARKRVRHGAGGSLSTPRSKGGMSEVKNEMLSRILHILVRSVRAGEDLDPFIHNASPPKSPKKKNSKGASDGQEEEEPPAQDLSDIDFDYLTRCLEMGRDSVIAAECCVALLGSDRLPKQLYSEETITACLNSVKNQLTKIIYPFVESCAESNASSTPNRSLLHSVVKGTSQLAQHHRNLMEEMFKALSAILPKINVLVSSESVAMSDTIIIQAVYIAIGPFFVVDGAGDAGEGKGGKKEKESLVSKTFGKSAMRGLRLEALALIRSIFANHQEQRSWIIEEILSSLIKLSDTKQKAGQFRLRDGRSIRTVSALLLQLVQTSAHDVRIQSKRIANERRQKFALKTQASFSETTQQGDETFLDEFDKQEIRLYEKGLDSAHSAAKSIIIFLTQRSGKNKATKNSNEAEYRTIFDNLISDVLVVLYWPEWPAASLVLSVACKYMLTALNENSHGAENNASKTIALDHLGVIAARIKLATLKFQPSPMDSPSKKLLKPFDEIIKRTDPREFTRFISAHEEVASHLAKRSSEDQAYDSAQELVGAMLGNDLAMALKHADGILSADDGDDDLNIGDSSKLLFFGKKIKDALQNVWKDHTTDVFDIGTQDEIVRIDRLAEEIGSISTLRNFFQPTLNVILGALDAPAIFMRTKALKALGQIVTSDTNILSTVNVRRAIERHLLDSSPQVRDAAVDLIGKYMVDTPEVAGDYYSKIADRIADTGLGVRKRVIKLLKSFYLVTDDVHKQIDIAQRLILRMLDEDDTVKDLAIKSIEELWFPSSASSNQPGSTRKNSTANARTAAATELSEPISLLSTVAIIMGVSAFFRDRQSPLEDLLHKIMVEKEGAEATALHSRYTEMCGVLIDGLVDATDLPGFTVNNCIRTIHLVAAAYPPVISASNAATLLPYLKSPTTAEEQATADYLLKIFRASIPHMPKTSAKKFGQELQAVLQPLIIKPSTVGGLQALQETVACICTVVQHLTHDFARLVGLLKSCDARLQKAVKGPVNSPMDTNEVRALCTLIFIVSLLTEHCNFDEVRIERPEHARNLDSISTGSIIEHIYNSLMQLHDKHDDTNLRSRILQCLGFLFRAQPTLMTKESSSTIMDTIFNSSEEDGKARMLKIIQEFLVSEAVKHSEKEKESSKRGTKPTNVNMDELVGNTDGFADSGVASAVVQRYLTHILDATLSLNIQLQAPAVDIMTFTVKQGLAHPLQSFPYIVALETSPNASLSGRANSLHSFLQSKHSSLLNTRYIESAKESFKYHCKVSPNSVQGYRMPGPVAVLQRWYSLVRDKRATRQDFLKSLVKVFQVNAPYESSQEAVDFTRYMAENFASFDYKTLEEVLIVIKHLTTVLSTEGAHVLEQFSPSHLLAALRSTANDTQMEGIVENGLERLPLTRTSIIISMVMLLKTHLKNLYSLSEDKCSKFVLNKKSALGDKPATRRNDKPISWDRLPFATSPVLTSEDVAIQKARFLQIWNEDGFTAEPEDDFMEM